MRGIYYSRGAGCEMKFDFAEPPADGKIVVSELAYRGLFPNDEINGEKDPENRWDEVEIHFTGSEEGDWAALWSHSFAHWQIGRFDWSWSGHGITEHWFDSSAVVLARESEYVSGSGLTASISLIVVYKRHVKVDSFREDCRDDIKRPEEPGLVLAGFSNNGEIDSRPHPRSDWTGFAISSQAIGDRLDDIIRLELGEMGDTEETVCKHLSSMRVKIFAEDPSRISRFLCMACRMRGTRLEEFTGRNRADMCPYFRRLAKAVVERSDTLPSWFEWHGDNLVTTYRRMADSGHEAFEAVYVRRKEGFIRRAVLLFHDASKSAWMYSYKGYIPRTLKEFVEKYGEPSESNCKQLQKPPEEEVAYD